MADLPPGWTTTSLGNCATWFSGGTPSTSVKEYWNGDIPWITASSLHDFYIRDSERKVTDLGVQNGTRLMPENTIIFVVRGMSLKSEFRVGIARRPVTFGQDCKAIVAREGVDPLFLANALRASKQSVLRLVSEASHGTGRLETEPLKRLEIALPPLPIQRRIAEILGRLDDKIEVNRRINRTLEQIAQALYQHWFVDFGPFQDGEFVESELGPIPKGWEVKPLDQIATYLNGLALQKYSPEGNDFLPVIKIAEMRRGITEATGRASTKIERKFIVEDGDVLFSWSGTLEVCLWCGGRGALNQHLFKVTSEHFPKWFYYYATKYHLPRFQEIAANKVTTMGHIQRYHLAEAKVPVPPQQIFDRFDRKMSPILAEQINNELENRKLAEIRDYLLPKLLSGAISVEAGVEQAAEATHQQLSGR
jgi:type I restriction enzyme S subunit